ncbi:MAG: phosphopantothenate/pantothenate synthetase [Euryarchaeota archaeon]|nr:phosphopantothenate/pantothenate synthetase [Euryarchaeota archaeon]
MVEVPDSHPRKVSLLARQRIVDASEEGLLAPSAMIAHGRGEAFDYLLGEKTTDSASRAIREAAARLMRSDSPVISVNGNTVVLAGKKLVRLAAVLSCPIEVNLYYRTQERVAGLLSLLRKQREEVAEETHPVGFEGDWPLSVGSVSLLGEDPSHRIRGLEGPRSMCTEEGIGNADSILVPLEDGDRCEALVGLGKEVIVVDLNPLSRSSIGATVTIVDEISRASKILLEEALRGAARPSKWDNSEALKEALVCMAESVGKF